MLGRQAYRVTAGGRDPSYASAVVIWHIQAEIRGLVRTCSWTRSVSCTPLACTGYPRPLLWHVRGITICVKATPPKAIAREALSLHWMRA